MYLMNPDFENIQATNNAFKKKIPVKSADIHNHILKQKRFDQNPNKFRKEKEFICYEEDFDEDVFSKKPLISDHMSVEDVVLDKNKFQMVNIMQPLQDLRRNFSKKECFDFNQGDTEIVPLQIKEETNTLTAHGDEVSSILSLKLESEQDRQMDEEIETIVAHEDEISSNLSQKFTRNQEKQMKEEIETPTAHGDEVLSNLRLKLASDQKQEEYNENASFHNNFLKDVHESNPNSIISGYTLKVIFLTGLSAICIYLYYEHSKPAEPSCNSWGNCLETYMLPTISNFFVDLKNEILLLFSLLHD
uniref:Uncharacterized protein n=1 Tax=Clastoptera arizonana TaxID=38151 RepID=A0A1B6CUI6_9HEMI